MARVVDTYTDVATASQSDPQLLLPEEDVDEPELTIRIPAVNEELTVGDFVAWCHEGIREVGVVGEQSDAPQSLRTLPGASRGDPGGSRPIR